MDTVLTILFSGPTLLLVTIVGAFISAAFLVYVMMPDEKLSAAKKMLGVVDDSTREYSTLILKILHPVLAIIGTLFIESRSNIIANYKRERRKRLIAANLIREISPEEFIAFKIVMTVVVPVIAHYLTTILEHPLSPSTFLLLPVVGFFAPEFWLLELEKRRKKEIFRNLPFIMDLLTLSVEAGLDFIAAIKRVSSRAKPSALIDELKIMLNEISLGTSRADSLRNLAGRIQMEEINSFTTLLIQADQLGASIGPVLRAQADTLRSTRFQKAETAGAKASQLVLFPMIFCIFPAVFIIVLGPLIVKFLTQGLTGAF